ncbi:hypothetical protein LRP52_49075 [Photobacterium sp. ZSDE20]|uniref:Secreted protein n=1 Tax=Photobacterium pectinilyticum TaxID=2906793 RepID=A0ABT1NC20_9GAMM|nr:hypothetical protein [Photobacterium sp. ZSDE20]MCQ1061364.1 hypothetical protein [Photobacterium sp. ZSDE20]MDD1830092.1 hypothetical protein [Photobacterium sp. ZSDE20]
MQIINKLLFASITLLSPLQVLAVDINQDTLCTAKSWKAADNAAKCKEGSKIAFLPNSFGNEQLPVMFIALNCDLRFDVSLTNGGAVCIFKPVENVVEAS